MLGASCSYRWRGVVSVCLSVSTNVSPAKTAKPIVMPFERSTPLGPTNHVLDGVHIIANWRIRWIDSAAPTMRAVATTTVATSYRYRNTQNDRYRVQKPATERSPIVRQLDACRTTRKLDTGGIRRGVNKQQVAPPSE